jgi:hypothetical protein
LRNTLTILWTDFLTLWKTWNETIHGHVITSQQQAWQHKQLLKMIMIHSLHNQVLAGGTDVFVSSNPATLDHFLDTKMATYVRNWIHVWKPFILSSVKSANDLALRGFWTMLTYFTPTGAIRHRPLADRAHRTARPLIWDRPVLVHPLFRFRSLRSFFALQPRPTSTTL